MSDWITKSFKFTALQKIKPPVQNTLAALEVIESILEALLALIKPFLLDLLNPLRAIIALLLAAIRAIINQIRSTGFSILLVCPDFSQPDFGAVINSVSGAYPKFESKVVGKFYDTSDLFRPTYGPGMTVGMLIFYIGVDSPGDLISQLYALISLINQPAKLSGLPAPVGLKALPVKQGGNAIAQFRNIFDSDFDKALSIEWRMPEGPIATGARGFVGQITAFYNSFRFPSFLVERTDDTNPQGKQILIKVESQTLGKPVDAIAQKYNHPTINTKTALREESGLVYRDFPIRMDVGSDSLAEGALTGSYEFIDKSSDLERGKVYFYRVRAYFGDLYQYLQCHTEADFDNASLIVTNGNQKVLRFGSGVVMGKPSPVVRGYVPQKGSSTFKPYDNIQESIIAGLLLNFELPHSGKGDSPAKQDQKTGWGTLGVLGGQIGSLKAAVSNSKSFKNNILVKSTARRLTNNVLTSIYSNPAALQLLSSKWTMAKVAVDATLGETKSWKLLGVVGGISAATKVRIDSYLELEGTGTSTTSYNGPLPLSVVSVNDRLALSDFVQTAISMTSMEIGYMSWYSVTVGDLFPALLPFLFDFEQFILALLKALNSALKEITDIIETILQKIRALEAILRTLLALIDLFNINVTVGILAVGPMQGGVSDLVSALQQSESKPSASPFGLHSGLVMTFGAPGSGALAALDALKYILTIPG